MSIPFLADELGVCNTLSLICGMCVTCLGVWLPMSLSYNQFWRLKGHDEALFSLLKDRPMNTTEVAKKLGVHRTTVSHYLNRLAKEGRLVKRKKGRTAYYGIKKK